jgi:hypothetical protein
MNMALTKEFTFVARCCGLETVVRGCRLAIKTTAAAKCAAADQRPSDGGLWWMSASVESGSAVALLCKVGSKSRTCAAADDDDDDDDDNDAVDSQGAGAPAAAAPAGDLLAGIPVPSVGGIPCALRSGTLGDRHTRRQGTRCRTTRRRNSQRPWSCFLHHGWHGAILAALPVGVLRVYRRQQHGSRLPRHPRECCFRWCCGVHCVTACGSRGAPAFRRYGWRPL